MLCAMNVRAASSDIVLYTSDATTLQGNWTRVADPSAAGRQILASTDIGWDVTDAALAAPADYVDFTFNADAGTPYHVWLRLRAAGNSMWDDSVWLQFSDATGTDGAALYRIGSTNGLNVNLQSCDGCELAGWGWMDGAYGLRQSSTLTFLTTGPHTLRVQTREDGVQIDQIVLSPSTYLVASPGAVMRDTAIVRKPGTPGAATSPNPAAGSVGVTNTPNLSWKALDATSYEIRLGTKNPPPTAIANAADSWYPPPPLAGGATYYWQIVSKNGALSTEGPVWSFVTAGIPVAPATTPNPAEGSVGVTTTPNLSWKAPDATSYEVRLGTTDPPPTVVANTGDSWFPPPLLAGGTKYYWQIVVRNSNGSREGPVWSFTTDGTSAVLDAGEDLQAALNSAKPGDTILLTPGATYKGNFVLRAKSGVGVITIRSKAPDAALPGEGTRITPGDAGQLPKIVSPNGAAALSTEPGAHHYTLQFLEFLANVAGSGDIITLGDGSGAQKTAATVPHHLIIDRCYVHGDVTYGQKRGIALNSASTTITNSYIAEIKAIGQDSQAIGGWNGPGPYTITNNYLEAAGENIMFGGSDPAIPDLVPSDITVRRNYLTKQPAWRTQNWLVKNIFELKNAQRVVVDGNVMEYNWVNGQVGYALVLTVRNQDGGCPWCVVQQVDFTNNIVRHVGSGINILGEDDRNPSQVTNLLTIRNNLFDDVSAATYGGRGCFIQIGQKAARVTVDHNTVILDGTTALFAYGAAMPGFVFTNNIVADNSWAILGDSASPGNGTISNYFPNSRFAGGIFAGSNANTYPLGNFYPSAMSGVGFVDLAGGNFRLTAASPFHNAATDGTDVGCDIDALNAATGTSY
jgi:hypothetical protein